MKQVLEWVIVAIAAFIVLTWMYGIRSYIRKGRTPKRQTVTITMLWFVSMITVLAIRASPLHLLWIFPLSFILTSLSLALPSSPLAIPESLFGRLCSIGLDRKEVARNTARERRFKELILEGFSDDDARRKALDEESRGV
jgi:hypothetical protein